MTSDVPGFAHVPDLLRHQDPPGKGILSRTIRNDAHVKVVLFGFAASEELSEHTASMPAVLHFLEGEARVTLGDESLEAGPGTWIYMEPNLKHSLAARTPVKMILTLVKSGGGGNP
jgi:quercetin dioxygenase-like cupin family protein